jgi:hypothetical protein
LLEASRPFRQHYYAQSSIAATKNSHFKVTHPFHPLFEREFTVTTYRQTWGEDRVFFHDDQGTLTSLPAKWTSLFAEDPLIFLSNSESFFRVPDLLELAELVHKNHWPKQQFFEQKESNEL